MFINLLKILVIVGIAYLLFFKIKIIMAKIKKIKDSLFGKYRWLRRKLLKKYNYFKTKNFMKIFVIKKIILKFLIVLFFAMILYLFFLSLNILRFENDTYKFVFSDLDLSKYHYDFLWSQISSTLILSTVIGFLGIFSTSYVYGKKQINIIFNSKGIFSLPKIFVYLVILIFISLSNCINNGNSFIILLCFSLSLLLIFYMLFKILMFYAFPRYYENSLKYEYLVREKKHIKKAMPMIPYKDIEIENFKYRTMELIQVNDNDYNKNISVLMNLLNISLLNNYKNIQEYYTEMIDRTDFISSILEIVQHLIIYNKILEATNIMNELFNNLKYYRMVPVQDYLSNNIIHSLILKGKEIDNEYQAQHHFQRLWEIVNKYIYLLYLYYCEIDFSYCRLGKIEKDGKNSIYYITHNNYLEDMYQSICENNHLTPKEKERIYNDLYNNIRMMEHKEKFPDCDVRHAKEYMPINKIQISIPLIIKGEPIVLMFLKMFEENDTLNLKRFITMNVSNELRAYIITLTSLALIEFIRKDCIREYVNDLNITEEKISICYTKSKFSRYLGTSENLYKILIENYTENNDRTNNYYTLLPRLTLSPETINNYFYYKCVTKGKSKQEFNKITKLKGFKPNKRLIEIFEKLEI